MWLKIILLQTVLGSVVSLKENTLNCNGVEFVSRKEWKARAATRLNTLVLPVNKIIIAHTVSPFCETKPQCIRNIQFIQDVSMDYDGMFDIPYNFLIGGDGRVYEGRGWNQVGSHSYKHNYGSIGIGFVGNYNDLIPSQKIIDAALNFIKCGVEKGFMTPAHEIHGHRDIACTESPGDNLYAVIRYWKNYKGGKRSEYIC